MAGSQTGNTQLKGQMKTSNRRTVRIRLQPELRARAMRHAEQLGVSFSELMRRAIAKNVGQPWTIDRLDCGTSLPGAEVILAEAERHRDALERQFGQTEDKIDFLIYLAQSGWPHLALLWGEMMKQTAKS